MGKLILLSILLVIYTSSYVVIASPEEDAACCPPGQIFLKSVSCLDPVSNTKTPISLLYSETAKLVANENMNFILNDAGQLLIQMKNQDPVEYPPGSFCMASRTVMDKNNSTVTKRLAIVSYKADSHQKIIESVRGYSMIVSCFFLFVTAIVFTCRPEIRTQQGKSVVFLCLSLGFGFGILAIMVLLPYTDMTFCAIRGFLVYFFLVASFFWMNVISLQILKSTRFSGTSIDRNKTPFVWDALYAWGFPIVFTAIMAVINFVPGDHLKPGIGLNTCWFFNKRQQWIYMYSVMSTLIAVNVGIFIYVSRLLWSNSFSSQKQSLKSKVIMTMRLFVVTGVPWIHEIISSLAPHCFAWEVLDILNCLQGVFIFFAMVVLPLLLSEDEDKHYGLNIKINQPYVKILL